MKNGNGHALKNNDETIGAAGVFHLSLSEWQESQGIVCTCGTTKGGYYAGTLMHDNATCALRKTMGDWRAACREVHERIRSSFPLLLEGRDGWYRESEQAQKDRLAREAHASS